MDLENSKVIDMIPSRNLTEVTEWLKEFPDIELVSRDGSLTYASAISEALPEAIQVSDRFHLVKNFTDDVRKYIQRTVPARIKMEELSSSEPEEPLEKKLTFRESLQKQNEEDKNRLVEMVKELYHDGYSIRRIAREYKMSRNTIRRYIRHGGKMVHASTGVRKGSILDPYRDSIVAMKKEKKTAKYIFAVISREGYDGSYSNLKTFISKLNRESHEVKTIVPVLSRKQLTKLLYKDISKFKKEVQEKLKSYIRTNEELQMVYRIVIEFKRILKQKDIESFPGWLRMVKHLDIPELNHFFRGIRRDLVAVRNAITHKESNGLVEGIINKIKLIKRTMYGRCSFELLRIKVLAS